MFRRKNKSYKRERKRTFSSSISEKFHVSIESASNILKRKLEYTNDYELNKNEKLKRKLKNESSADVNAQVYE